MRLVYQTKDSRNSLELAWTWLPTWLGMNPVFKNELEKEVLDEFSGQVINDDTLEKVHEFVITRICSRYPDITGLSEYLHAVEKVDVQHQG